MFKFAKEAVCILLIACLVGFGCVPGSPSITPPAPVDPGPPLEFVDVSDGRVAVGHYLIEGSYEFDEFETVVLTGYTSPNTSHFLRVKAEGSNGALAKVAVLRYQIWYQMLSGVPGHWEHGQTFHFNVEVRVDPETGETSLWDVDRNTQIVAGLGAALISGVIAREILQTVTCFFANQAFFWWGVPGLCINLPPPFKALLEEIIKKHIEKMPEEAILEMYSEWVVDPLKMGEILNLDDFADTELKAEVGTKIVREFIEPYIQVVTNTRTLISANVQVEYLAWQDGSTPEPEILVVSYLMDPDGDGIPTGIEVTDGTDPFDPNDPGDGNPFTVVITKPAASQYNVGDNLQFDCSVTGGVGPFTFRWQLPDEISDEAFVDGKSFSKVMSRPGEGVVYLFVTDKKGRTATASKAIKIVGNTPNVVDITSPSNGDSFPTGSTVTFTATGSGGTPTWNFSGVGAGSGAGSASGFSVSRTFTGTGSVQAVASIGSASDSITVNIVSASAPTVSITNPQNGATLHTGVATNFAATATAGATVTWLFPDGSSLTGLNVSKTFNSPVSGTVTATATNGNGSTTASISISVVNPNPGGLSLTITSPTLPVNVVKGQSKNFNVDVTGGVGPYHYKWHFPDSDFWYLKNFTKFFDVVGQAYGYVTVTDSLGAEKTESFYVTVTP